LGSAPQIHPEPRGRSSFGLGLAILGGLFVIFLVMLVVVGIFSGGGQSDGVGRNFSFGSKVAILEVTGVITEAEPTLRKLREFRDNDSVKAVVLRIDSPGGAVAPTQEIYTELKRFRKRKPVVASMASVAASGGFYVAMPCNYIFASPGTLTGSIGVIMNMTDLGDFFNWLKIKQEVVKSGKFKDAGSPFRALTPEERDYFQGVVSNVHGQFKAAILESRKLKPEQVEEIADGRVFTGEQAKDLGLIDGLGNLEDAINKAGELGGIKGEPEVLWPVKKYNWFSELGSEFAGSVFNKMVSPLNSAIWYLQPGTIFSPQGRSEQ
jgi:protease IV